MVLGNGSDEQRRYTALSDGGVITEEIFFCGSYEQQIRNGDTTDIHYLESGIMAVRENGGQLEYYFTYGDYLGSILAVTDDVGAVIGRRSYDAWGRERSAVDWTANGAPNTIPDWLYRGYTSHEMLPSFQLINMNGRLYDNKLGRMLSIDNYAGQDGSSQSFNRYSYVLNNPLMYTDPDGENPYGILQCDVCTPLPIDAGGAAGSAGVTALGHGLAKLFDFGNDNYFQVGGNDGIIINGIKYEPFATYGGDDPFVRDAFDALNYLLENEADVTDVIVQLACREDRIVEIREHHKRNSVLYDWLTSYPPGKTYFPVPKIGVTPYIIWDSEAGLKFGEKVNNLTGNTFGDKGYRSPSEALLHELAHLLSYFESSSQHSTDMEKPEGVYSNKEEKDVILNVENKAADALKHMKRYHHYGKWYKVVSPTSIEPKKK